MSQYEKLIALLEAATAPSREIDAHMAMLLIPRFVDSDRFWGWRGIQPKTSKDRALAELQWEFAVSKAEPYTLSLDDALELQWGEGEQRLHPIALERYGYEKARRIGMMAMVGGKHKKRIRNTTPSEFRDLLLAMASTAKRPATEDEAKDRG